MKKILITRKLIKDSEDKASKIFEAKFNSNDEEISIFDTLNALACK